MRAKSAISSNFPRKKSLSFVKVASADLFNEVTVDAKEAEEYYNSHREAFRQPERVKFSYVPTQPNNLKQRLKCQRKILKTSTMNTKEDRFTTPPRVQARHILFPYQQPPRTKRKIKCAPLRQTSSPRRAPVRILPSWQRRILKIKPQPAKAAT